MFKKFQEYTIHFFYDAGSSDSLSFLEGIYMILLLAELASPFFGYMLFLK